MNTRHLLCGILLALLSVCTAQAAAQKPNIILILADDMGWSELGCYGNTFNVRLGRHSSAKSGGIDARRQTVVSSQRIDPPSVCKPGSMVESGRRPLYADGRILTIHPRANAMRLFS